VSHKITLRPVSDVVINVEHESPGEANVRSTVLLGSRYTIVFDTLYSQRDMYEACVVVERQRRPVIVINSHADEDHSWGNAAFPLAPIVAQEQCRDRFTKGDELVRQLAVRQKQDMEEFGDVVLTAPDVTFSTTMALDAGGFTVVLHHLPGHKRDCLVAHIPELGLFLGGDTIESPIPLLVDGPLNKWAADVQAWAERPDVKTVIPSHGPVSGPELLVRNAEYLRSLAAGRDDGWSPTPGTLDFYIEAHKRNVSRAKELPE
jgi:glyoxylase-like metal-dependent hydrolase (beta-lactamase superfamily II)